MMSNQKLIPCEHCPWKTCNPGKRTPWGFYTKRNLTRLWNQIRKASGREVGQSCHPTDPKHEDHIAAGAKEGSVPQECAGSIILVFREINKLGNSAAGDVIGKEHLAAYAANEKKFGLTKRGILHWVIGRWQLGGTPFGSGPKLPDVDIDDPTVSKPEYLNNER